MTKREYANRPSTPWLKKVRTKDGRLVENRAFDPKAKKKAGDEHVSRAFAILKEKEEADRKPDVAWGILRYNSHLTIEQEGSSGYVDIGDGQTVFIDDVADSKTHYRVLDENNETRVEGELGSKLGPNTVDDIASNIRRERLFDMDTPSMHRADGGNRIESYEDFYIDNDPMLVDEQGWIDEDSDDPYQRAYQVFDEQPELRNITDRRGFAAHYFDWDKNQELAPDLEDELDHIGFFDTDNWEAKVESSYYNDQFEGYYPEMSLIHDIDELDKEINPQ